MPGINLRYFLCYFSVLPKTFPVEVMYKYKHVQIQAFHRVGFNSSPFYSKFSSQTTDRGELNMIFIHNNKS